MKHIFMAVISLFLAAAAAAQENYRVSTGDTLSIEVLEDSQLNRSALVLPDGTINFPFAGSVRAAGRTVGEIQAAITDGIAGNFAAQPTVFVTVSGVQPRPPAATTGAAPAAVTIDIYITGEVGSPGVKPVKPGTTFLQAMAQSGGFTQFAATKRLQLRRLGGSGRPQVHTINYRALSNGAALSQDIVLMEGDVILVPERRLFE